MKPITSIVVAKLGSSVLGSLKNGMQSAVFTSVLRQAQILRDMGVGVIVISSGAMLSARLFAKQKVAAELAKKGRERDRVALKRWRYLMSDEAKDNPALSSLGQPLLMEHWREAGLTLVPAVGVSQMLVTEASIRDRQEWRNTMQVIHFCFGHGIVPIVNYNDAVSFAEVEMKQKKAGENDKLTAEFAPALPAQAVAFITEAGGVHTAYPPTADTRLYREINWKNPPFVEGGSVHGRGGMGLKFEFAIKCRLAGIKRVVITGLTDMCLIELATGKAISTMIGNQNMVA